MLFLLLSCAQDPMALALKEEPGAVNVMHGFTSADMETWDYMGPIAWGVASLGMTEAENGDLLVTAIQEVRPPSWLEEQTSPPVRGYRFDGETWHPKAWRVEDDATRAYIDPQMFEGQMWYISPVGIGDPAKQKKPTPIRSSNPGMERVSGYGLADPSPVRFKGELHLFATKDLHILHKSGPQLQTVTVHPGMNDIFFWASVPHASVVEEEIWLVAQTNIGGRRIPVFSKTQDGYNWSKWDQFVEVPKGMKNCTSPVLGSHPKGGWILLCIEELLH